MSNVIENEVVQLEFDNSRFEKNVEQSIKSIDKLKESLTIGPKTRDSITESVNRIDLSGLANQVDNIAYRFSTFGIAGMTAIQRITNAAIDLGLTLERKVVGVFGAAWNQIITGGTSRAANIEQATFQLKGIFGEQAEGQVKLQMAMTGTAEQIKNLTGLTEDLIVAENAANYAVADTAYGLDSAAKAASVLATSGVDVLKFSDELADSSGRARTEMQVALRAISGTAAMANSSYDEIAHIYERISGQGRVMGQDLESLSARGLNAAATLANYLNEVGRTANATQADIKQMVSKGEIDFMTFARAMDEAYGDHAKDANSTFQGAFDNMRFALSKIGADFIAPMREDLIPVLNNVRMTINAVRASLGPFVDAWKSASAYVTDNIVARFGKLIGYGQTDSEWKGSDQWVTAIKNITNVVQIATDTLFSFLNFVDSIVRPIREAWKDIFPSRGYDGFVEFLNRIKDFIDRSVLTAEAMDKLKRIASGFFSVFKLIAQVVKPVIAGIIDLGKNLGWIKTSIVDTTADFGDFLTELAKSNKVFDFVTTAVQFLSSCILKMADIFRSGIRSVSSFTSVFITKFGEIRRILSENINMPALTNINFNLDSIKSKLEPVVIYLGKIKEGILFVGKKIVSAIEFVVGKVKDFIVSIFKSISEVFSDVPSYKKFEAAFDLSYFGTLIAVITSFITKTGTFQTVLSPWKNFFKNIQAFFASLDQLKDSFTAAKRAIVDLPQAIRNLELSFGNFNKAVKNAANLSMLTTIAVALVAFTASVYILSKIDAEKAIGGIIGVMVIVRYLQNVMNDISATSWNTANLKGARKAINSLVLLSLSTLILASAISKVTKAFGDNPAGAMFGLVSVYVMIEMMMRVMDRIFNITSALVLSKGSTKVIRSLGLVMLEMAIAVKFMAGAINTITKAFNKNPLGAVFALVAVAALLEESVRVLEKLSSLKYSKGIGKAGFAMMEIGAAVVLMAAAIKIISTAFKSEDPAPGIFALISVCVLMEVMVHSLQKLSDSVGRGMSGIFGIQAAATALIAVAASLAIIGATVAGLSSTYSKNPGATLAAVTTTIVMLLAVTKILQSFNPKKALSNGLALIEVAIAISLIAKSISLVANSYSSDPLATVAALGTMIVMLAGMVIALEKVNPVKAKMNALAMIEFAAALYLIGLAVAKVGSLGLKGALVGVGSLVAVLLAIAGFAGIVGGFPVVAAGLIIITACITSMGAAMLMAGAAFALFGIGLVNIAAGIASLAAAWAVSGPMIVQGIVGTLSAIAMAIPTVASALAHGLLSFIEVLLDHVDVIVNLVKTIVVSVINTLAETAPMIAQVLVTILMYGLDLVAANIGPLTDKLITIIINLINAISTRIPDILGAIEGLLVPIFDGLISLVSSLLSIAAEGIGEIFGSLIGGILEGLNTALKGVSFVDFATQLSDFMLTLEPFIDGLNGLNKDSMEAAMMLAGVITILTADAIIAGLTKWLTGGNSMTKFGEELAAFGPYIKNYAESVKGIDVAAVEASTRAAQMLADFARTIPNEGGLIAKIFGDNDIESFGEKLYKFGPYIKKYADSVKGIDVKAVEASTCAAQMIADFARTIPNEGGLIAKITGDNDIRTFGSELKSFGKNIAEYADEVKYINAGAVEASVNAAKMVTEFAATIPNSGGFVSIFTGDNTVDKFGQQLVLFGLSISNYYNYIKNVNTEALSRITSSLISLFDILGIVDNLSMSSVNNFHDILQALADMGLDGFLNSIAVDSSDTIKSAVEKFAENVTSAFATETDTIVEQTKLRGKDVAVGFANGIKDPSSKDTVAKAAAELGESAVQALGDSIGDPLEEPATEVIPCGHSFDLGFEQGIKDYSNYPINASDAVAASVLSSLESRSDGAYNAGYNLIDSFKLGQEDAAKNLKPQHPGYYSPNLGADLPKELPKQSAFRTLAQVQQAANIDSSAASSGYDLLGDVIRNYTNDADDAKDSTDDLAAAYQNAAGSANNLSRSTSSVGSAASKASSDVDSLTKKIETIMDKYEDLWDTAKDRANKDLFKGVDKQGDKFLDSVQNIMDKYKDIYTSAVDMTNSQDLFAEVKMDEESFAPETLLNNLEDQVNQVNELNTIIGSLSGRIADNGLREAISQMSVDDLPELRAMYRMDNTQLSKYESMYQKKVQANQNKIQNELTGSLSRLTGQYTNVAAYVATDASTNQLLHNLQAQVDQLNDYNATVASLTSRIKDVNLREAIAQMGVESIDELKELNRMTDAQLEEYTNLYNVKIAAGAKSIKQELSTELGALLNQPIDIDEFYAMYSQSIKEVGDKVTEGGDAVKVGRTTGNDMADGTIEGLNDSNVIVQATNTGENITNAMAEGTLTETGITKIQENITSILEKVKEYLENEIKTAGFAECGGKIVDKIASGIKRVKDSRDFQDEIFRFADKIEEIVLKREPTFEATGKHIINGIAIGMDSRKAYAIQVASNIAKSVINTFRAVTEVHSPSRVFMAIGRFIDEGLAIGLRKYAGLAEDEAGSMAEGSISAVQDAIQQLSGMLDGSIDVNPIITPTLDLSEVNARSAALANMFAGRQIAVQAYRDDQQAEMMTQLGNILAEQNTEPRTITFNQTNNSPKALSRTEIYRQTRNGFSQLASAIQ